MNDEATTPRVCEACGQRDLLSEDEREVLRGEIDCPWCSDGYQNPMQQVRWREFRRVMSKISGTYSVFESLIKDLLVRLALLGGSGDEKAWTLRDEGEVVLQKWLSAEPTTTERAESSQELLAFNRKALDYLLEQHDPAKSL